MLMYEHHLIVIYIKVNIKVINVGEYLLESNVNSLFNDITVLLMNYDIYLYKQLTTYSKFVDNI